MIFGFHQEAATMEYLTRMVLRGAAPQREAKKHTALRVGLKYPVCFVVGSRRLIIKSRLDPPPHIRDISAPSQSWPLLGQAPGYIATLVPVGPAADFFWNSSHDSDREFNEPDFNCEKSGAFRPIIGQSCVPDPIGP